CFNSELTSGATIAINTLLSENISFHQTWIRICFSIPANNMSGGSHVSRGTFGADSEMSGSSAAPLPSPASAGAALVSPETLSRHSSPPPIPLHPSCQPAPSCSSHRVHMESPLRLPSPPSLGTSLSLQPVLFGQSDDGTPRPPLPPARRQSRSATTIPSLHFGQYWELERNTNCHNVLLALTPATRMAFIFIQMYFIFLNNEKAFASMSTEVPPSHPAAAHLRVPRGLKGPHHIFECRRTNIMGSLVQDASPFLFPCTIEYSLICAAILYVMWKNISKYPSKNVAEAIAKARILEGLAYKKSPHLYSVDCARAHKGLFFGILVLVLTIISLILFFVLVSKKEYATLAVVEVNVCELGLYAMTTIASLAGMVCVRNLKYDGNRNLELDNILLVGAQTGMFIYGTFTIIGGHFTIEKNTILILVTALSSLIQTTCQTMFILDASRRSAKTPEQLRKKPGREIITFLLVTNLAMWAINTLEKSRAESHPIQLHFYGLWAWTIITHVSMPLAIFYRFHSTVCLCEIWKRAYKMKPAYM
ncbi:unnamed protein product, partial [Leptidea sinapis]